MTNKINNEQLEFLLSLGLPSNLIGGSKGSKNKMKNKKQKVHKMKYNSGNIKKSVAVNDEFLLSL